MTIKKPTNLSRARTELLGWIAVKPSFFAADFIQATGISIDTVRKAINLLIKDGLITKRAIKRPGVRGVSLQAIRTRNWDKSPGAASAAAQKAAQEIAAPIFRRPTIDQLKANLRASISPIDHFRIYLEVAA